jgi:eukaryotic-like serine/threonine-protein kinase
VTKKRALPSDTGESSLGEDDSFLRAAGRIADVTWPRSVPRRHRPGDVLASRYVIRKLLGRGGMGVVHAAFDRERGSDVALKTLSRSADEAYRLKNEFRALSDVVHPSLVVLHELVVDDDLCFFTMELIQGDDLATHLGREPALAWPELERVFGEIAQGVHAIHARGKLHGDLKPSNVLLTPQRRVKIVDFGLTREAKLGSSAYGLYAGTPGYMAPELRAGKPADAAADCYAFGVMLEEALRVAAPSAAPAGPASSALHELCQRLLRTDPRERPSGSEILRHFERRPDDRPAREAVSAGAVPFFGRDPELDSMRAAFARSRQGQASVVLVHGVPGIGKTALVDRFLREIGSTACVVSGRCYERESVSYKAFDGVAEAIARFLCDTNEAIELPAASALVRVFPVLRRARALLQSARAYDELAEDPHELRQRAFTALKMLLARIARQRGLVVFIDDLQWGDADSAALIADLVGPPETPAMLLVGCFRTDERASSPLLTALERARLDRALDANITEMKLDPLGEHDARELARGLVDGQWAERAGEIAREAGGSPYLVCELARQLRRSGSVASPAAALTLGSVIESHVAALDTDARTLLETVCVAGQPMPLGIILAAARATGAASDALPLLRHENLVRLRGPLGQQVEAYHDRVRETVVARLGRASKRDYHLALANALEQNTPSEAELIATHFRGAGVLDKAARHATLAADRAGEALAFEHAAELYRFALEHTAATAERRRLQIALGEALANAGRGAEAAPMFQRAAEHAASDWALRLRTRAAEQLLVSGQIDAGLDATSAVLTALGKAMPRTHAGAALDAVRARLELAMSRRSMPNEPIHALRADAYHAAARALGPVQPSLGAAFQSEHMLAAMRSGDSRRIALALALEVDYVSLLGSRTYTRSGELLQRARAAAANLDDAFAQAVIGLSAGTRELLAGRWLAGVTALEAAEKLLHERCRGVIWELNLARCLLGVAYTNLGRIEDLRARGPLWLRDARRRGDVYTELVLRGFSLFMIALANDDPDGCRDDLLDLAARLPKRRLSMAEVFARNALSISALYAARGSEAYRHSRSVWSPGARLTHVLVQSAEIFARYTHALGAIANYRDTRAQRALRVAQTHAARLQRIGTNWARALAASVRAGIAEARGRPEDALAGLEEAVLGFHNCAMQLHELAALRQLGLLRGGADGRAQRDAAERRMQELGICAPARFCRTQAAGF